MDPARSQCRSPGRGLHWRGNSYLVRTGTIERERDLNPSQMGVPYGRRLLCRRSSLDAVTRPNAILELLYYIGIHRYIIYMHTTV